MYHIYDVIYSENYNSLLTAVLLATTEFLETFLLVIFCEEFHLKVIGLVEALGKMKAKSVGEGHQVYIVLILCEITKENVSALQFLH